MEFSLFIFRVLFNLKYIGVYKADNTVNKIDED